MFRIGINIEKVNITSIGSQSYRTLTILQLCHSFYYIQFPFCTQDFLCCTNDKTCTYPMVKQHIQFVYYRLDVGLFISYHKFVSKLCTNIGRPIDHTYKRRSYALKWLHQTFSSYVTNERTNFGYQYFHFRNCEQLLNSLFHIIQ